MIVSTQASLRISVTVTFSLYYDYYYDGLKVHEMTDRWSFQTVFVVPGKHIRTFNCLTISWNAKDLFERITFNSQKHFDFGQIKTKR